MKDELDHFEVKSVKRIPVQIFLPKRLYPYPVQLFRIRIRSVELRFEAARYRAPQIHSIRIHVRNN
jgi:hypothetical protein